ncbi:MAG: type II toxin-antitoxin system RelE/ParE family toxin [Chitinophagaceae bacterium]
MGYKLSVKASDDLEEIWFYTLKNWSLEQADRYVNLIFDEIEYLSLKPLSGKDYSNIREGYRRAKVKSHLIFYRMLESKSEIEVIRILHENRDIENRLKD